jgi:hypothetical protein
MSFGQINTSGFNERGGNINDRQLPGGPITALDITKQNLFKSGIEALGENYTPLALSNVIKSYVSLNETQQAESFEQIKSLPNIIENFIMSASNYQGEDLTPDTFKTLLMKLTESDIGNKDKSFLNGVFQFGIHLSLPSSRNNLSRFVVPLITVFKTLPTETQKTIKEDIQNNTNNYTTLKTVQGDIEEIRALNSNIEKFSHEFKYKCEQK